MKNKWAIIIGVIVVVVLAIVIIATTMQQGFWLDGKDVENGSGENVNKINASGEISEEVIKVGEFDVENLKMEYRDGYTYISADILNNTANDYVEGASFTITLFEGEKQIATFPIMSSTLPAGGKSTFNTQLTMDCTLATDIKIVLNEQ